MAKKIVVVGIYDSPAAENAFDCKLFIIIGFHGNCMAKEVQNTKQHRLVYLKLRGSAVCWWVM